ncbi:hypothetical protein EVAR_5224_1 [Eumeta japonica]|uniref:Peptidase S1 domain-containing protein n=1 Tax=Eumeta variegata TaxID=151549 RepID=A0A4C1V3X7_EUMVA|nr:hypothetical protein EVAR_5224_1 [Eumeta japonica]
MFFLAVCGLRAQSDEASAKVPWHVGIYLKHNHPYRYECGGFIVACNLVITDKFFLKAFCSQNSPQIFIRCFLLQKPAVCTSYKLEFNVYLRTAECFYDFHTEELDAPQGFFVGARKLYRVWYEPNEDWA